MNFKRFSVFLSMCAVFALAVAFSACADGQKDSKKAQGAQATASEDSPSSQRAAGVGELPSAGQAAGAQGAATMSKAQAFVAEMGIGINLGNTMEACGDWISGGTVSAYETAWGSPVITKPVIQGYADAGFKTLRVPVAWSNMMSKDGKYTIAPAYLARVRQIAEWALECGMYVIVNEHWDGGWWADFPAKKDECMEKYKAIWTQVCAELGGLDGRVVFESLNEEGGWDSLWNKYAGTNGKRESFALLNEINQAFVDLVRATGGNNAERLLLIAGYQTDIANTCDPLYKMPDDPAQMCAVSVHYYSPATFAILTEDAEWGKNQRTWGTAREVSDLAAQMQKLKAAFVDKGIPVIIGEYGCPKLNKEAESVQEFLRLVCLHAYKNGMCPVLWDIQTRGTADDPFCHYDRKTCKLVDAVVAANFKDILEGGRGQGR